MNRLQIVLPNGSLAENMELEPLIQCSKTMKIDVIPARLKRGVHKQPRIRT